MYTRKSLIEQPEINRSGILQVKIAKLMLDNETEIDCQWHRTAIAHNSDPIQHMNAVNDHLLSMGYPAIPKSDIDLVASAHALMKTWLGL